MDSSPEKPQKASNISLKDIIKKLKNKYFGLLLEKMSHLDNTVIIETYLKAPDFPLETLGGKIKFVKKPHALLDKSLFIGEAMDNKPNGLGYHMDINGNYYEGFFEHGKFNGKGRLFTTKGQIFTGHWSSNTCPHGTIYNFDKKFYEGEIKDFEPHGNGKETAEDYVYDGEFFMSKKHGQGRVAWNDGNWYQGEFCMGKIEGKGKYHWKDSEYEGYWKVNKMHGQGIQVWTDGSRYDGYFEQGLKHGYGVYKTSTKIYSGYWKHGKEDGKGKLVENDVVLEGLWLNGKFQTSDTSSFISEDLQDSIKLKNPIIKSMNFSDIKIPKKITIKCSNILEIREKFGALHWGIDDKIFISEKHWKKVFRGVYFGETTINGFPHGRGIWLNTSQIYEGYFIEGERNGFGRLISLYDEVYIGNWIQGLKQGYGVLIKPNAKYSGDWEMDKFNGLGILITNDLVYEGDWKNNFQHGKGILKYSDRKVYKGDFVEGIVQGDGILVYPDGHGFSARWNDGECETVIKKFRNENEIEEKEEGMEIEEASQLEELKKLISTLD